MEDLALLLERTILIIDMNRFPVLLKKLVGNDSVSLRFIWDKDFGFHGIVMNMDALFKLTKWESLNWE